MQLLATHGGMLISLRAPGLTPSTAPTMGDSAMRVTDTPLPWMSDAACAYVSPALWFPVNPEHSGPAIRICAVCPVVAACREYAIESGQRWGTWGGLTQQQLRAEYAKRHRETAI